MSWWMMGVSEVLAQVTDLLMLLDASRFPFVFVLPFCLKQMLISFLEIYVCTYMCRDVFCQMLCVLMLQSVIVCGLSCCHRNAVAVVLLRYLTPSCSSVT